jgi:hypothetical protein
VVGVGTFPTVILKKEKKMATVSVTLPAIQPSIAIGIEICEEATTSHMAGDRAARTCT